MSETLIDLEGLEKLRAATAGWQLGDDCIWDVDVEYGVEAGCCGNFLRSGECCGNAVPVQTEQQVQVKLLEGNPEALAQAHAAVNALPELIAMAKENERLKLFLQRAAVQFRYYEEQHNLKGPEGEAKARVNAEMAEMCEAALPARTALKEKPQ